MFIGAENELGLLKKIRKKVKKAAKKIARPVQKIAKKVVPKKIRKVATRGLKLTRKVHSVGMKTVGITASPTTALLVKMKRDDRKKAKKEAAKKRKSRQVTAVAPPIAERMPTTEFPTAPPSEMTVQIPTNLTPSPSMPPPASSSPFEPGGGGGSWGGGGGGTEPTAPFPEEAPTPAPEEEGVEPVKAGLGMMPVVLIGGALAAFYFMGGKKKGRR